MTTITETCACGATFAASASSYMSTLNDAAAKWRENHRHESDDGDGWTEAMRQRQRVERALLLAACWDREADACGRSLSELMLRDAAKTLRAALAEDAPTSEGGA